MRRNPIPRRHGEWVFLVLAAALLVATPGLAATAEDCAACHDDVAETFASSDHGRAFAFAEKHTNATCESCHGPGDAHVESGEATDILNPARLEAPEAERACATCHDNQRTHANWRQSEHRRSGVTCVDCHAMHQATPPRRARLLEPAPMAAGEATLDESMVRTTELCLSCHADVRSKMQRTSHHPVREGKMGCTSCHDPHGSNGPSAVRGSTVNEACLSCHEEKRGPFLWEHAPVRQDCQTCHEPHGSNNRALLAGKEAFVCMQCHSYGGHINLPRYNRVSNPYGSGCVNCHTMVHGSNHPSGAKLTR
jgi:DmsE family decaheme c-type cytochrome